MAQNEDRPKGPGKGTFIAALVAGIVLVINGVIQLTDGNMPLGVGSLVLGAAVAAFSIFKLTRKS